MIELERQLDGLTLEVDPAYGPQPDWDEDDPSVLIDEEGYWPLYFFPICGVVGVFFGG